MGFKTFTSAVLTAADVNDYLMEQANIVCTSATRPTAQEGMVIYETDTDRVLFYNGTGWVILAEPAQSYTPTPTNLTLGNGTLSCYYHRSDGYCDVYYDLTFGTTTTISGTLGLTIPVTAATQAGIVVGNVILNDNGTATYLGQAYLATTSRLDVGVVATGSTYGTFTALGANTPHTWASTDFIHVGIRYRMANRYT